jgi:hypothetical protein
MKFTLKKPSPAGRKIKMWAVVYRDDDLIFPYYWKFAAAIFEQKEQAESIMKKWNKQRGVYMTYYIRPVTILLPSPKPSKKIKK